MTIQAGNLKDAAIRLLHAKEREQWRRAILFVENGTEYENTNYSKLWFWACQRWQDFPDREYELRAKK